MGQRLQRFLGKPAALTQGQFCVERSNGMVQTETITISCPQCASLGPLPPAHKVGRDGRVVPAWMCLAPGCSFQDFVELDGLETR
jgi:hypothetical protein